MNKPKLNQPDVEQSTTEPNMTIKSPIIKNGYKQYENYCPHCKSQVLILGNYCPHCGKPINWAHSNVETTTLPYKKVLIQPNPTLEEVKKEWEDDDYTWEENERFIIIYKEHPLDDNIVKEILINKCTKNYECYDAADYDNISLPLTLEEHTRLTKTFRAKGWEVNNNVD